MTQLERNILEAIEILADGRPSILTTAREIQATILGRNPMSSVEQADIEESVRHMHRDGRGLCLIYSEGSDLELRLAPAQRPALVPTIGSITVKSGNVQVGNHNQMQFNENSYGGVLVDLKGRIEALPISHAEKRDLLGAVERVLGSPALGTLLTLVLNASMK